MSSDAPPEIVLPVDENSTEQAAAENAPAVEESNAVELKPKTRLQGTVARTELQGAIVNVDHDGKQLRGLLHISQLSAESVKNVADVVKEGDSITVFVLAYDDKSGRLDLTLIQPPDVTWNELKVNDVHRGKVVRIERFGVFIDIGAERPGMIHVSELTKGYVNDPADVVKLGDELEAKVIGVNRKKKQIDLSVKAMEVEAEKTARREIQEVQEVEEDLPTAMELALRRAMEDSDIAYIPAPTRKQDKKRNKHKKSRTREQDDIFERTLRMHNK